MPAVAVIRTSERRGKATAAGKSGRLLPCRVGRHGNPFDEVVRATWALPAADVFFGAVACS